MPASVAELAPSNLCHFGHSLIQNKGLGGQARFFKRITRYRVVGLRRLLLRWKRLGGKSGDNLCARAIRLDN